MRGYFLIENSFLSSPRGIWRKSNKQTAESLGGQRSNSCMNQWQINYFYMNMLWNKYSINMVMMVFLIIRGIFNFMTFFFFTFSCAYAVSFWILWYIRLTAFSFGCCIYNSSQHNFDVTSAAGVFNKYIHCKINFCHTLEDSSSPGTCKIGYNICVLWFLAHSRETKILTKKWVCALFYFIYNFSDKYWPRHIAYFLDKWFYK